MPNNTPPAQPLLQIKITAMRDGNVNVSGFPTSLPTALKLLSAAKNAVVDHFINQAKAGNLDDHNTILPKKIIETQKPALVGPDGKPLQ